MSGKCECGKVRYFTRKEAKLWARKFLGTHKGKLRAYRCGCFWHLTSEPTSKVTFWRAYMQPGTEDRP